PERHHQIPRRLCATVEAHHGTLPNLRAAVRRLELRALRVAPYRQPAGYRIVGILCRAGREEQPLESRDNRHVTERVSFYIESIRVTAFRLVWASLCVPDGIEERRPEIVAACHQRTVLPAPL